MIKTSDKLFVYGSLRSGFRNPAYSYITGYFNYLGEALVRGQLYDAGEFPVARPCSNDHFITGELYQIKDPAMFDWAFEQLDDYEGLNPESGEPALYTRELADIYQNGKAFPSWIYWFNGDAGKMPVIPVGDVLKYLQEKNKPR